VLLTGGEACFTSGNDLSDFLTSPPGGKDSPAMRFLEALSRARKPVIAAVNGMAIGIGVTMLLHCDLVYAGASACFQMPFVNLGLCPEGGSSFLLPRMMGHQRAAELLLLGECFDASTAREAGIVNSVCPDHELRALARAGAEKLAARPPSAMRLAKNLLKRGYAVSLQETMAEEGALFGQLLKSPEAVEAMRAFLERRKPDGNRFAGKTG
jgi:enoyl-CoA hydratase/carnithine racemase